MGYRDDIRHEAEARGIRLLVHFSPFANLVGIAEHGLLPRTELNARGLGYTYTDALRLDEDPGATSLSISVPNLQMLQRKRRQAPHLPWAVLYFDPSVLWTHDCRYTKYNRETHWHYTGRTSIVIDLEQNHELQARLAVAFRDVNHHKTENATPA